MTKRKLIAQLRECAEDVERKPILLYSKKNRDAMDCARIGVFLPDYLLSNWKATVILLLILADMLEAE